MFAPGGYTRILIGPRDAKLRAGSVHVSNRVAQVVVLLQSRPDKLL